MVGKDKTSKAGKSKKALEKEWAEACACAETGDPLIASANNILEKQQRGIEGFRDDYDELIAAARSGKKGKEKKPKKEKKKKAKKGEEEEEEPAGAMEALSLGWTCDMCGEEDNTADDAVCISCGFERPEEDLPEGGAAPASRYTGYKVGVVLSTEEVPRKAKLLQLEVDVGGDEPLQIVTNAPNVTEGSRVVVATVGAMVGEEVVKKASVGGVPSEGMLCDNPMLGWTGGGAGVAALVPESFAVGQEPPSSRPRMDGK